MRNHKKIFVAHCCAIIAGTDTLFYNSAAETNHPFLVLVERNREVSLFCSTGTVYVLIDLIACWLLFHDADDLLLKAGAEKLVHPFLVPIVIKIKHEIVKFQLPCSG